MHKIPDGTNVSNDLKKDKVFRTNRDIRCLNVLLNRSICLKSRRVLATSMLLVLAALFSLPDAACSARVLRKLTKKSLSIC